MKTESKTEEKGNRKIKWNPRPAHGSILKTDLPPTGVF